MTLAYWCVLIAAVLPFLFTGIAKFSGSGMQGKDAREFQTIVTGWRQRAHWAHVNSLEIFPLFAAGVIIAHAVGGAQSRIDALAIAFIVSRLVYFGVYVGNKPLLRTTVWSIGILCIVGFFVVAAQASR